MVWLLVAISIYAIIFVAGRAHSRHLDRLEARWKFLEDSATDPRSRMSNHNADQGAESTSLPRTKFRILVFHHCSGIDAAIIFRDPIK